jgi:hypothetical protein
VLVRTAEADPDARWLARGARAVLPSRESDPQLADDLIALCSRSRAERSAAQRAPFVAESPGMRAVAALAERAARSRVTVLLLGETGTGKEVVARAIHAASARAERPVDRDQLRRPARLAARERAVRAHARRVHGRRARPARRVRGGAQRHAASSTRSARTRARSRPSSCACSRTAPVRPLGGTRSRDVDVRVIAATHRDLSREVARGRFREDLFFGCTYSRSASPAARAARGRGRARAALPRAARRGRGQARLHALLGLAAQAGRASLAGQLRASSRTRSCARSCSRRAARRSARSTFELLAAEPPPPRSRASKRRRRAPARHARARRGVADPRALERNAGAAARPRGAWA